MAFGLMSASGVLRGEDPAVVEIRVTDHGAVPDDGRDDGPAVRAAVAACAKAARPCLLFPPGKYHFSAESTRAAAFVEFNDLPEITVRGEHAELVGTGTKTLLLFQRCGRVSVSGLDVDWDPLPFTAGRVAAVRGDSIDVKVVPPHPLRDDSPVESIISYDGQRHIPLHPGDREYFLITQKAFRRKAEIAGPGLLRIPLSPEPEKVPASRRAQRLPAAGSHVLAWYRLRGGGAFRPTQCGEVRFENCRVFATTGMGFAVHCCDSASLRRCQVAIKPGTGRWMSSTVDATHFNMVRKSVEIVDCTFEGMGDDAANVHGTYAAVHERVDDRTVILRGWKSPFDGPLPEDDLAAPALYSHRAGDPLEFSTKENPLAPAFEARVDEASPVDVRGLRLRRVRVDRDLPRFVEAGTVVGDSAEAPRFLMKNCIVRGNRGCGVRVKTRGAVVEDCTFEDVHGAGVWVTCDAEVDHESIATRGVAVRNNVFRRTSPAISVSAGRGKVYPEVHEDLRIEGNRIEECPGAGIQVRSTKGGVVRGNSVSCAAAEPIQISLSSGVSAEDNRVVPWKAGKQPGND